MTGHYRRALVAFTGVFASVIFGTVSIASGSTPPPPKSAKQELASTIAAALAKGSVRVIVRFVSGKTTGEVVQDSTKTSGIETVAIGKERASILLSNGTAYFTANQQGFISYFGFSEGAATTLAGEWVSAGSTDPSFATLTAGMTLNSALNEISPSAPLAFGKHAKINGEQTIGIIGGASAGVSKTVLFVAAKGKPLPVEAVSNGTSGSKQMGEIVALSRWGEKVQVPVPTKSIPYSDLPTTSPSAG